MVLTALATKCQSVRCEELKHNKCIHHINIDPIFIGQRVGYRDQRLFRTVSMFVPCSRELPSGTIRGIGELVTLSVKGCPSGLATCITRLSPAGTGSSFPCLSDALVWGEFKDYILRTCW